MDEITYKDGVYYIGYQDPGLYEFYYNTKEKHLNSIDGLDSYFDDFLLEMMNEKLGEEEVERLREGDGEFDFFNRKDETRQEVYSYIFDKFDKLFGLYKDCKKISIDSDYNNKLYPVMNKFVNVEEIRIEGCRWYYLECSQFPISVKKIYVNSINLDESIFYRGKEKLVNLTELTVIEP